MKAIYAGSFDPFTKGHLDILKQACPLFDRVWLVIAINKAKERDYYSHEIIKEVEKILIRQNLKNVNIYKCDGLIADFAMTLKCDYLIRGIRNPNDYNYEENIAKINSELNPGLKTIYFRANNEIISSSFVKELFSYGKNVSDYVEPEILELMEYKKKYG